MKIELSILIITHNQRDFLKRCIESVLNQELPFGYEIIISDDHSTDGTWDLIEDLSAKMQDVIKGYKWEREDASELCAIERAGWNRLNAYLHCSGKYFAMLDADDYLIGTDVYKKQYDLLEAHPNCSMCQHRVIHVKDGEPIESGFSYYEDYPTGTIIAAKEIIKNPTLVDHVNGMMIRRQPSLDMQKSLGVLFDDRHIIFQHLLYGDLVCLNEYGYVYVNYAQSICQYGQHDAEVLALKQGIDVFTRIQAVPQWAGLMMKYNGIRAISNVFKLRNKEAMLVNNKQWTYRNYEGFIFDFYSKPLSERTAKEKLKAFSLRWMCFIIKKLHISGGPRLYKTIYAMTTSNEAANKIPSEYWK